MRTRRLSFVLLACATLAVMAVTVWRPGRRTAVPPPRPPAITVWKGGDLLACLVTVDGASLQEFARDYDVVMLCGLGDSGAARHTDRTITVSRAFAIQPRHFDIEEAVSGPMRVRLAAKGPTAPPMARTTPLAEEPLWYELALVPRGTDALAIDSLGDVERLGGRLLMGGTRWTVITAWLP